MYTQRNLLGPCEGMMRFWLWVIAWMIGLAGQAAAMTCIGIPRIDSTPPIFPLADLILSETGVPDGEESLLAFGKIIPVHKAPLLHERFYPMLEQSMRGDAPDRFEVSDTQIEFTYFNHFEFRGVVFRGGSWQVVEGAQVVTHIIISGEGGYSTWLPTGEDEIFLQLEVGRNEGTWNLVPRWCGGSFTPAEENVEASMAELATCLPLGNCHE